MKRLASAVLLAAALAGAPALAGEKHAEEGIKHARRA